MVRRLAPFIFMLMFSVQWVVAAVQDCPVVVENAMARAQNACAGMGSNQACYGYRTLEARLADGLSQFAFNAVGDITPIDTIESLRMSALDPVTDEWGVTVMRVRADISDSTPNQNVTLLAFGSVLIDPDLSGQYQPMQAFTFTTGESSSGCTNITENGLLIQTPEGIGRVTLWINQVKVRIGSTVLFQAEPGGDLTISTFEGLAQVEAMGQMQEAIAGTSVRVLMNADLQPAAPPTFPEPFDAASMGLTSLVNVTTSYTDGSVTQLFASVDDLDADEAGIESPVIDTSNSPSESAITGDSGVVDDTEDCNRDHGQGNPNGNCFGHTDPPGNDNPPGNDAGQDNGSTNDGSPGNSGGQDDGNNGQPGGLIGNLLKCVMRLCILSSR